MADIKTVVTTYGEYIGELTYESGDIITLSKPKMVIQSQEGFGFAKGVCVTSVESPDEVELCQSKIQGKVKVKVYVKTRVIVKVNVKAKVKVNRNEN